MDDKWAIILHKMAERMERLQRLMDRDYNGGLGWLLPKWQEVKYWKEAIERGEFDDLKPSND